MLRPVSTILCFILAVSFVNCAKDKASQGTMIALPPPAPPALPEPNKKYLALGDSYTIGQGVLTTETYPAQTRDWLLANGITAVPVPEIIATTGWTTENLQAALKTQNPKGPYRLVSLLIGVNDQYRRMDIKGYETRFRQLVQEAIWLADNERSHVFVLSIPDYSVTPFASQSDIARIAAEIDAFNAVNKQVALSMNVKYLDITGSSREAKNNPLLVCPDGLHPSALEYKKWAEKLGPLMKEVLK